MESVRVRQYSLWYHGSWSIDRRSVERALTRRTRAIVLVNPNNPTGSYVKRDELAGLTAFCAERDIALISDEVFADYSLSEDDDRVTTLAGVEECLTFSMSGLSKVAGLPQMKLGWIVVNGPAALRAKACENLEWVADTYLSVSTPVQCAAARLLAAGETVQQQIRERSVANLAFARAALAGSAANILNVEGGWYITLQVPQIHKRREVGAPIIGTRRRAGAARVLLRFRNRSLPRGQPVDRPGNLPRRPDAPGGNSSSDDCLGLAPFVNALPCAVFLPHRGIGQHLDEQSADHRARLEALLLRRSSCRTNRSAARGWRLVGELPGRRDDLLEIARDSRPASRSRAPNRAWCSPCDCPAAARTDSASS